MNELKKCGSHTNDNISYGNVSIKTVAKLMGKSQQFIRISLQRKSLPIGNAEKMPNSSRYNYYISPKLFSEYTGISIKDLRDDTQD